MNLVLISILILWIVTYGVLREIKREDDKYNLNEKWYIDKEFGDEK